MPVSSGLQPSLHGILVGSRHNLINLAALLWGLFIGIEDTFLAASSLADVCLCVMVLKHGCSKICPADNEGWVEISNTVQIVFETLAYRTF